MFARLETRRCVECGMAYSSPGFWYHKGMPEKGAAYWCDRGILCSPRCSLAHVRRREMEGTLPDRPAPNRFGISDAVGESFDD